MIGKKRHTYCPENGQVGSSVKPNHCYFVVYNNIIEGSHSALGCFVIAASH